MEPIEILSRAIQQLQSYAGKSQADVALIVALKAIYAMLDQWPR